MFTGIIQALGKIESIESQNGDARLLISTSDLALNKITLGDSVAVNGVCLTVTNLDSRSFTADVSRETLAVTTLGKLNPGALVNLELALTLATPLGGHLVNGHVDGIGIILEFLAVGRSQRLRIQAPVEITRYIAPKGSITVDGVSLTVNQLNGNIFEINLIPHTLIKTISYNYRSGELVNLEVDIIARYLERLLSTDRISQLSKQGITKEFLIKQGFI